MPSGEKAAQTSAGGDGAPPLPLNVVSQAAAAAEGNAEDEARQQGHGRPANEPVTQDTVDDEPPPPYGDNLFEINQDDDGTGVDTKATLNADGRIDIRINQHTSRLSAIFTPALQTQLAQQDQEPLPPPYIPPSLGGQPGQSPPPPMNVVIHVVGSRGDVQPFVALGKVLKETYGHRVRLATHPTFQQFVTENGLEFFSIGGDPAKLMAFMVKNPGLMPGFDVITSGDVGQRRKEIYQMIRGCWRSCIETGDGTGVAASDATTEDWMSSSSDNSGNPPDPGLKPFIADAIIANPPSFAHVHCAEKLGCPLHVMFTMPYSPTQAFPHPLANIQSSNADPNMTNFLTYGLVDMMTWQGLGDLVNRFRQKSLGLEPISLMFAPGMLARLRIPHTYCWSPALIPKPKDWSNHISISGFYFLSLASNFTPEPELANFLAAGPPPVYIGFGSIVVDDPNAMTEMIFDAVRKTGQRALVSKGWGGIGADELGIPEGVMMLGNVPHDWLFNHVSAVVHHGGAGTTAAGIAAAKPTVIVPFFGDQPFWGAMIAKAGAGPDSIAYKDLDADKLAASITFALKPETLERTKELATRIKHEDGCQNGAQSFHQQMHVDTVRCSLAPSRCAVWHLKKTNVRLSALAATVLANQGLLDFKDLKLFRSNEYETEAGPTDPITGGASALIGTGSSIFMGFSDFPAEAMKAMNLHPASKKKGKQKENPQKAEGDSTTGSGSMTPTVVGSQDGSRDDLDSESVADTQISDDKSLVTAPTQPTSPLSSSASQSTFNLGESLAGMHDPASDNPEPTGKEKEALSPSSTRRGSSLFDALGDELARRMNPPQPGQQGRPSASPLERKYSETLDTVLGTSKGVSRMLEAGLRSPMDFTHSLARGFHNAPKLYGDDTVRKQEQITDFKSGLRAAGKGFGLGLYDGISGLVTQPMSGAKKEGMAGFIKGVGKGIGGIILKPQAAVFGLPGYMMKGVYAEISAISGKSTQNYIIAARTAQGYEDYHNSNAQERNDIERRWRELQLAIKKKKNVDDVLREWGQTSKSEGKESKAQSSARRAETRKKIFDHLERTDFRSLMQNRPGSGAGSSHADGPAAQGSNSSDVPRLEQQPATPSDVDVLTPVTSRDEPGTANSSALGTTTTIHHPGDASVVARHTRSAQVPGGSDDADLEAAIRASLAQASTGSADDDAALEAAIRASVAQLEHGSPAVTAAFDAARNEHEEGAAIDAALQASLLEYERTRGSGAGATTGAHGDSTGAVPTEAPPPYDDAVDDDGEVAEAIKRSLAEHRMDKRSPIDNDNSSSSVSASAPADGPAPASGSAPAPAAATSRGDRADEHEAEVERAIQASLAESKTHDRERTEEEIVLEYVKRQSLLEEEHRRRATGGGGVGPGGDGAGQGSAGASSSGGGSKS